jgi:myo-inositol 2-dehydrogenase/D-chiro-inositol 1-dehydrogenase
MPAEAVRVGVVGCGRIGRVHAELVAQRVPGATLVGVFDSHGPSAVAVASALGVPAAESVEALVARDDVDAVAVCSNTDTHVDVVVAAAQAGKAIFCEKPISIELAEVDRALAAVELARVPLQIGFNRRFDPGHRSVRDAVAAGSVGDVHIVRISSRDPVPPPLSYIEGSGGIFLDMTIHDFDMARYVTGSDVVEVYACGAIRIDPSYAEAGDLDTVVVTLTHDNGAYTVIDNSRRAVYGFDQRVEVFGSAGVVASDNLPAYGGIRREAAGSYAPPLPTVFLDRYHDSYAREWEAFVEYVREGGPSPVDGAAGRAPLVIGLAAWRSTHEGRPVSIAEIGAGV